MATSLIELIEPKKKTELLRVGTVGVASTPLATTPAHRLSFVCDVQRGPSQNSLTPANYDDDRSSVSSTYTADATDNDDDDDIGGVNDDYSDDEDGEGDSTLPPLLVVSTHRGSGLLDPQSVPQSAMTERTRSSYMTNDTATASCISGLSDFPAPPTQTVVSPDQVEVLKSYFGDDAHPPAAAAVAAVSRRVSGIDGPEGIDDHTPPAVMRVGDPPTAAGPSQASREPELQQQ